MTAMAVLAQVDDRALEALQRMATAQLIIASILLLIGIVVLGAVIIAFSYVRSTRRAVESALNDMRPGLAPLLDRAKHAADDMAGMTDTVRRKVDDIVHTAEELRRAVRRGTAATEARVERFTAVLDIVQTEAEELLLDAAATARGVHETARALREPRRRPAPGPPAGPDHDDEETTT